MRAVVCNEYGPSESLRVVDVPDPVTRPGHVLIDVAYAAVNFPDVLIIANLYQVSVPLPFTPGSEFSGTVASVGEGVVSVRVGDHVFGPAMSGSFAGQVVVPAEGLRVVPPDVPLDAAAGFWVAHATAYHALRSVGR